MALSEARFQGDDASMKASKRRVGIASAAGVALLAISIPVLAASPSPAASPSTTSPEASAAPAVSSEASTAPATSAAPAASPIASPEASAAPAKPESPKPEKTAEPEKTAKLDKGPETTVALKGTVQEAVDGNGRPAFTMTVDGKTWNLSAGPPWFWGDNNPLTAYVGKSVTVAGTTHAGDTEVDVETVDGKSLRAPGKPPWAGGPWVVGPTHPGWKDWMADGKPGNGHGRDSAPGQIKKATPAP